MSMDLSDVLMDDDFLDDFQLIAWQSGTRDAEGNWSNTYAAPSPWRESIQPASNDALQVLPEGERSDASCVIFSKRFIRKGDGVSTDSDLIVWQGITYRVVYSQFWNAYGYFYVVANSLSPATA